MKSQQVTAASPRDSVPDLDCGSKVSTKAPGLNMHHFDFSAGSPGARLLYNPSSQPSMSKPSFWSHTHTPIYIFTELMPTQACTKGHLQLFPGVTNLILVRLLEKTIPCALVKGFVKIDLRPGKIHLPPCHHPMTPLSPTILPLQASSANLDAHSPWISWCPVPHPTPATSLKASWGSRFSEQNMRAEI